MDTEKQMNAIDMEMQKELAKGAVPAAFTMASIIKKAKKEEKPAYLRYFLENIEIPDLYFAEENFYDPEYYRWKYQYDSLIHGYIKALVQNNYPEVKFYDLVWWFISISTVIEEGDKRLPFALVALWEDSNLPYYCLPEGIRMEENEFNERREKLKNIRSKLLYASDAGFMQRTEKASILLDIINSEEEPGNRAVLMSDVILNIEEKASERLQNQLSRKLFSAVSD